MIVEYDCLHAWVDLAQGSRETAATGYPTSPPEGQVQQLLKLPLSSKKVSNVKYIAL